MGVLRGAQRKAGTQMKINMNNAAVFLLVGGFKNVRTFPPCDKAEADYYAENRRGSWVISCHGNTDMKALLRDKTRYGADRAGLIVDVDKFGFLDRKEASWNCVEILNRL